MSPRIRYTFLALVLAQAAHSIEEYAFRLYEVFAPARFVSSLISDNAATGFAVGNIALVLFGFWCYLARVRSAHQSAAAWMWFWALLEFANGIGHSAVAFARGTYFPGVVTAPVLLALSIYLASQLARR